jgi:hypothetical protein
MSYLKVNSDSAKKRRGEGRGEEGRREERRGSGGEGRGGVGWRGGERGERKKHQNIFSFPSFGLPFDILPHPFLFVFACLVGFFG